MFWPHCVQRTEKGGSGRCANPLLIIGAGGLGLAAINLSLALYGVGPVVADIDASKRQAALDAGASAAVDPADPDIRERLMKETGGFSAAIDFVGAESTTGFGLALLRKGGRIYVVGLFGGSMEIPLATLPLRAVGVVGSFRRLVAGVARIARTCPRRPSEADADRDHDRSMRRSSRWTTYARAVFAAASS